jgi:hypothetical protein
VPRDDLTEVRYIRQASGVVPGSLSAHQMLGLRLVAGRPATRLLPADAMHQIKRWVSPVVAQASSRKSAMTPIKFILRYTAVPFMAIVAVVSWASLHSSAEIDARQYAALSGAYASFPVDLRRDIRQALQSGKLSKWDYSSLVRESLNDGVVLDWPSDDKEDVATEREKLAALVKADRP